LIIREVFLYLKNKTDLFNRLNASQFRQIPPIIYENAKIMFCTNKKVYEEDKFIKKISNLYGFIYLASNQASKNRKKYVGQTALPRTIEREWNTIVSHARSLIRKREKNQTISKIYGRYIHNAIAKYGEEVWKLELIDIAYNKSELDVKEDYYIVEIYDSINRDKGYNLKRGGASGKHNPETLIKMGEVQKKVWLRPGEKEKRSESMREAWNIPGARKRRGKIAQDVWDRSGYKEKHSKRLQEAWKKEERVENFKKGRWGTEQQREKQSKLIKEVMEKFRKENPELYQEQIRRLIDSNKAQRKEIADKREFLMDIKQIEKAVDLYKKYNMSAKTLNNRIIEILGLFGVINYRDAKKFLQGNNIDKIFEKLEEITENPEILAMLKKRLREKLEKNREAMIKNRENIASMRKNLMDINNIKKFLTEIKYATSQMYLCDKYNLKQRALNDIIKGILFQLGISNYKEAKPFLKKNDIDEISKKLKNE